jgi:hypothetical protein
MLAVRRHGSRKKSIRRCFLLFFTMNRARGLLDFYL